MQYSLLEYARLGRGKRRKKSINRVPHTAIVLSYPLGYGPASTSIQQLFAIMTAVQISPEILLNQMRKSSVYYHLVIDSDKCWAGSDVNVMKKLSAKLSIMFPLIKLPIELQREERAELHAY